MTRTRPPKGAVSIRQMRTDPATGIGFPCVSGTVFSRKWILYDTDNLYPQHLRDLSASPTHNAALQFKRDMAVGDGLTWDKSNTQLNAFFNTLESSFPESDTVRTMEDLLMRLAWDLFVYGGMSLWVSWSKGALIGEKPTVASVAPAPFETMRLETPDSDDDLARISGVWFSRDWANWNGKYNKPRPYPMFSRLLGATNPEQMQVLWHMSSRGGSNWYPYPDYIGAVNDIKADSQLSLYRLAAIENGFVPGMILTVSGITSQVKQDEFYRKMEQQFQGPANANKMMVLFDEGVSIAQKSGGNIKVEQPKSEGIASHYDSVQKSTKENILLAHRIHKSVAGMDSGAQLGGEGNVIRAAMGVLEDTVVKSARREIESIFQRLAKASAVPGWETIRIVPISDDTPAPAEPTNDPNATQRSRLAQ